MKLRLAWTMLTLLPAQLAAAQVMTVAVTAFSGRDNQTINPNENNPVGIAECNDATLISFRVSSIPSSTSVLDFWRGSSCNLTANRGCEGASTACTSLSLGAPGVGGAVQQDINEIPLSSLVDCTSEASGTNSVFILAASRMQTCDDIMNNWGVLNISVDRLRPTAPGNVRGGNGQNSVSVNWDIVNENNLLEYRVYVEQDGCAADSALQNGGSIPDDRTAQQTTAGTANSATISGDQIGEVGSSATVGVAAVDRAKNVGLLGTTCVQRIKTTGFCNTLDPENGCPDGCQVAAFGSSQQAWMLLGWLTALITWATRRRSFKKSWCS